MRLATLIAQERKRAGLSVDALAARAGVMPADVQALEGGAPQAETWGARFADLAIALEVPISRLIAESGRAADHRPGDCGRLVAAWRAKKARALDETAAAAGMTTGDLRALESGLDEARGADRWMPVLLAVAQAVDQPLFNFFYPYGVPLRELEEDEAIAWS
jgi:transcriptional regulator with XRE-family HTH domain